MTPAAILFYILSAVAVTAAFLVVRSRNPIHSAIWLVVAFLSIAAVYVELGAEFVAAVQVLVYAGGIMVLFLFVILLVNLRDTGAPRLRAHASAAALVGLVAVGAMLVLNRRGQVPDAPAPADTAVVQEAGNLQEVGFRLFGDALLPFEIASVLLLVAMVGAIVLAGDRGDGTAAPKPQGG
jgi:NADH-quinone oxidoreductase subunit J